MMPKPRDRRYSSARWLRLRAQVIRRDGRRCSVSGCTSNMSEPSMMQVDHVVEVKDGGAFWDPNNLRLVCRYHHFSKTVEVIGQRQSGRIGPLRESRVIPSPYDPANPPPGCTCRPRNVSPKSPNDAYCDLCESLRTGKNRHATQEG